LYQDWLFDDRGAASALDPNDPQDPSGYLFSAKAGSITYPTGASYASNAADLVELRVKPLASSTAFRVTLNTLIDPSIVGFTIALGDSIAPVDWPYSAGVTSPAQLFLSVKGRQIEILNAENGLAVIDGATVSIDLERRQYTINVPHAAWNPGTDVVRMAAGVGLWDAASNQYSQPGNTASATAPGGGVPGASALFNIAFRGQEPTPDFTVYGGRTIADAAVLARVQAHWWRERLQANALQAGDISEFFANVDFGKLTRNQDDESSVPKTGFMNRIFTSRFSFGQGMDYPAECGGISVVRPCEGVMRGQLLPYAVYVPEQAAPAKGFGLTVFPHALSANYNQYLGSRHAKQLGDRGTGTIVITGTARGPDGFYYDAAEADIFEVWADAAKHFPLDPNRVVMTGISMGGIGSFRVATRFPDLFGRIMPVVASASGSENALPSLRHVPVSMWSSTLDELQNVAQTEGTISALLGLNYRLDSYRFETWDHLTPSTNDYYAPGAEFLLDDLVQRNPAHVTYVLRPNEDSPDVGLIADKAYWLSDLQLHDPALGIGTIDAFSEGLGLSDPEPIATVQSLGVLEGGYHAPSPFTRRILEWVQAVTAVPTNRLRISASNIAGVSIDAKRAGLSCSAEIQIDSATPIVVSLTGC
jgi:pimeloyl-ACP methyl ester carboxylesterase